MKIGLIDVARMKKVAVFGNAAGGKSTLARRVAELTRLALYPLDVIQYKRGGGKNAACALMQEACMATMGISHEITAVDQVFSALGSWAELSRPRVTQNDLFC
jgi:nicotinamide riboside kinase